MATSRILSYLTLCLIFIGIIPSCAQRKTTEPQEAPKEEAVSAPWITVWVHGTQPPLQRIPGKRLRTRLQKHAHEFFYCQYGIHHWHKNPETNRYCSFARLLAETNPELFPEKHFYTFGWSGDLNFKVREAAADVLYQDLVKLVAQYTATYGIPPHVRVITHSHGGNVALNLALAERIHNKKLVIDELVLLACPIQAKTAPFAQEPLFRKVYSFYSSTDLMQVGDPQGLYRSNGIKAPLFSQRLFPAYKTIAQARVRFNNRSLWHVEFLADWFVRALPAAIKELDTWHQEDPMDLRGKQIKIVTKKGEPAVFIRSYARKPLMRSV